MQTGAERQRDGSGRGIGVNSLWWNPGERRERRGARLTRRVREEYRVYFDRNATMSGAKRRGSEGMDRRSNAAWVSPQAVNPKQYRDRRSSSGRSAAPMASRVIPAQTATRISIVIVRRVQGTPVSALNLSASLWRSCAARLVTRRRLLATVSVSLSRSSAAFRFTFRRSLTNLSASRRRSGRCQ